LHLAYFDESGDRGYVKSPTKTFTLGCLLVEDSQWLSAFDALVNFRRFLKARFSIRMKDEIKAQYLVHNTGPFVANPLPTASRVRIYRQFMRLAPKAGFTVFAVVIEKDRIINTATIDPMDTAWHYAIQRLERFGNSTGGTSHMLPDQGHIAFIRSKVRKMRRSHFAPSAFAPGTALARPATNVVEDPSERLSHHSYFVQFADLVAYAAFRHQHPGSTFGAELWNALGSARLTAVSSLAGGPPGIVVWP
jgi:hypothetical protein